MYPPRRGLLNFVLQSATSGPIFLKCVDASAHMADGGTKDAEFIAEQTLEVLDNSELLGFNFKDHFGVIWMDGASNNVLAGEMLESLHDVPEYPWLCVEWCTPHLANVLLGKFGLGSAFGLIYLSNFIFPTKYATQTLGFCNTFARFFTMLSPMIVEIDIPIPMICLTSFCVLAGLFQSRLKISM